MKKALHAFLRRYGQAFTLNDALRRHYGVFSPKSAKSPDFLSPVIDRLGEGVEGDFLLLTDTAVCKGDIAVCKGDTIMTKAGCYHVMTADDCILQDERLYRFAVLRRISPPQIKTTMRMGGADEQHS